MLKTEVNEILETLETMFPDARCELNYQNIFELTIAVMLSAQTTDKKVNKVTEKLFKVYPTVEAMANAKYDDVIEIIRPLGLASNKTKNLLQLAKIVMEKYHGIVPSTFDELTMLPGIGRKTANVVLSEGFHVMRIAVDTHVERVSKRLGISSDSATVLQVENDLMNSVDEQLWHRAHHLLLFFGRYFCKAMKPSCANCPFINKCKNSNKVN